MRRPLAVPALVPPIVLALVLALAASLLGGVARADDRSAGLRDVPSRPGPEQALRAAHEAMRGTADRTPGADRSPTLALRDLFAARSRLTGADRASADRLLARPSATRRKCGAHVCVHWTTSGANAATTTWADKTLDYMDRVWLREVGDLGYRAPLKDGTHGGNAKLDVYLKDLGSQGIYGYCTPEYVGSQPRTASSYCALDNDFSRSQFGIRPVDALHVTAAHEFFHATQFAYDYLEDGWIMEATATWMEEQVADAVNDNRQYLPYGQLGTPSSPLDFFDGQGVGQYGQWLYFQYLQQLVDRDVVRKIWEALPGRTSWSVEVLESAVGVSFKAEYAAFVGANLVPGSFYAEGAGYQPTYDSNTSLDVGQSLSKRVVLDHLTYSPRRIVPGAGLADATWQLQVTMDGPNVASQPMLVVVWEGVSGDVERYSVDTDSSGAATFTVPFSSADTRAVYVAAVNAGNRYTCFQNTDYACAGLSKDDNRAFTLTAQPVAG